MCSRSPWKIGLPLMNRRIIVKLVSIIGRPNAIMGIATATTVEAFCAPRIEREAKVNPMNKAPQSPRKIEAGLKLYRRKPISAPVRSEEHTSELQSLRHLVCRLLLEKKKETIKYCNGESN